MHRLITLFSPPFPSLPIPSPHLPPPLLPSPSLSFPLLLFAHLSQCVALYDYIPTKCSPNENPEFELELREGALVKIVGQELTDGFLVGEIDGHRGLVPAAFISEVELNGHDVSLCACTIIPG